MSYEDNNNAAENDRVRSDTSSTTSSEGSLDLPAHKMRIDSAGRVVPADSSAELEDRTRSRLGTFLGGAAEIAFSSRSKGFRHFSRYDWLFFATTILNILFLLSITIERLARFVDEGKTNNQDFIFAWVILIVIISLGYFNIHAIFLEQSFEIAAGIASIGLVLIYVTGDYFDNDHKSSTSQSKHEKLARIIGEWCLGPANIIFGIMVIRGPKFLIAKTVGVDVKIQEAYRWVTLFITMTQFDVVTSIVFLVLQYSDNEEDVGVFDKITLGVGPVVTFFWLCVGWVGVRTERNDLCMTFFVISVITPIYVIYKMVLEATFFGDKGHWQMIGYAVEFTGTILLCVRISCLICLYNCGKRFGSGLKEKIPIFVNPSKYNFVARIFAKYTYYIDNVNSAPGTDQGYTNQGFSPIGEPAAIA